jgi:type IV secretory pathway TrbD component
MASGAVLIGSGPSLNVAEVGQLGDFPAIAFNRSFIAWRDWGFAPRYYACTNAATAALVVNDAEDILAFEGLRRIWLHRLFQQVEAARSDPRVVFVTPAETTFGVNGGQIADYGNVGASSLQLLWSMGHNRVLLMGADGRYQPRGGGPSINHFRPDYIPAGFSSTASPRTEKWNDAVADARAHGMELRLRSRGSALSEIAGLEQDTAALAQTMAWLGQ